MVAGIHIGFFSPSPQPSASISRWHTCLGKILLVRLIGKSGNRTACYWKVLLFIFFTWPHVCSCSCRWTLKIQVLMKTKASLTARKAEISTFHSCSEAWTGSTPPACILLVVLYLLNALSSSKHSMQSCHMFKCSTEHRGLTKWTLNLQWFQQKANLSLFSLSSKWITGGQNMWDSQENKEIVGWN